MEAGSAASSKTFSELETYVKELEGTRPLKRVLLANNGIAAIKFIRSVRSWSYKTFGKEKEVTFVCMATPEDLQANAEYIRAADEVCHVPGGSNINNYANVNLIVECAVQYKVDGVWAGWGHASENPLLPNTLDELDIVFIGPPGAPMYALGDKIGSSIIGQSAGVPMIAWNGQGLTVDYKKQGGIPPEIYDQANVKTVEDARAQIEKIGLPVMIKASEGGGGKGIRVVEDIANVESAFRQVQSELPGSPIFIMRLSSASRHLEVQLLADQYGQAIALSGRDCSVQRRHQKILEEGPAVSAKPDVWLKMEKAAVELAKEVGYVNAGTVEYLYDADDNFFFLELNPRLQVEHPVTEMITGMNLPACQMQVAMGIPLHRIPDVRLFYGQADLFGASKIDFDGEYDAEPTCKSTTRGHTIAARITAENPFNGFQPTSGKISEINFRSSRNVWGYFSVDSSGRVHEFADSQIGHVFAWGETREEARRSLAVALGDLTIRGDIRTTIEYLKDLIESDDYVANKFDTTWLDARIKRNVDISKLDPLTVVLVGAVITGNDRISANGAEYLALLARGQLPPPALLRQSEAFQLIYDGVKYALAADRTGLISFRVHCNGSSADVELRTLADGGYLVLMGGKSLVAYVKEDVGARRFMIDGQTCLFAEEYDPTQMRALMGGKLLRYLVDDGAEVAKDQPFAEIEVMKMNMQLSAQEAGCISLVKPAGSVMEPGDVIATLELQDPSKVRRPDIFEGRLPALGDPFPQALDNMPHSILEGARLTLGNVMEGYAVSDAATSKALADIAGATNSPLLPVLEVEGLLSRSRTGLPPALVATLERQCKAFRKVDKEQRTTASAAVFARAVLSEAAKCAAPDAPDVRTLVALAEGYAAGLAHMHTDILAELIARYVAVEKKFADLELSDAAEKDDVLQELRAQNSSDVGVVFKYAMAHASRKPRDDLVHKVLATLEQLVHAASDGAGASGAEASDGEAAGAVRDKCAAIMQEVAALQGANATAVALEARQTLIEMERSYKEQQAAIIAQLRALLAGASGDAEARDSLVGSTNPVLTYLMDVVVGEQTFDAALRNAALRMYVERVYASYKLVKVESADASASDKDKDKDSENNNNNKASVGAIACNFTFFSEAADAVQFGSGGMLTSVSSFDDLTAILSSDAAFMSSASSAGGGVAGAGNQSETETSSVGMDLDTFESPLLKAAAAAAGAAGAGAAGAGAGAGAKSKTEGADGAGRKPLARQASDYKARSESIEGNSSNVVPPYVHRQGKLVHFADVAQLEAGLAACVDDFVVVPEDGEVPATTTPLSVLHVIVVAGRADTKANATANATANANASKEDDEEDEEDEEDAISRKLGEVVAQHKDVLVAKGVRRLTFAVVRRASAQAPASPQRAIVAGHGGSFFTFRSSSGFAEDRLVRNIETPLAFQLDLQRLANFNIRLVPIGKSMSRSQTVHVYEATPKARTKGAEKKRYFVRALVRQAERVKQAVGEFDAYPGPERVFVQALEALEALQDDGAGGRAGAKARKNHIFMNVLSDSANIDAEYVEGIIRKLHRRYARRLTRQNVEEFEIRVYAVLAEGAPSIPIRVIASNPTGFALNIDSYVEAADPDDTRDSIFYSISEGDGGMGGALAAMGIGPGDVQLDAAAGASEGLGSLHGKPLSTPYVVSDAFDERRAAARAAGTTYAYDFPDLFRKSLEFQWHAHLQTSMPQRASSASTMPARKSLVEAAELVLHDELDPLASEEPISTASTVPLCTTTREPGRNAIAMVAWELLLRTPQYPEGRQVVLIVNDITTKAGSFGTREDVLFDAASKYAREHGLPRLYIAANSGARIGMAEEVKRAFKVKWVSPEDPAKGYQYVYVDEDTYRQLGPDGRQSIIASKVEASNDSDTDVSEAHWKVDAIVGEAPDLGVENLRGSGTIAGETARAYQESFTLSYVSARTVGIGAYLVRLGQRTIQKGNNAPILLTGYQALNSLMGRDVYTSNLQLGGPKVMFANGVSHHSVRHDLEGVMAMTNWLGYVPERRGAALPLTSLVRGDRIERAVEASPAALGGADYDPRLLLCGFAKEDGQWAPGFFDRDSFTECLSGWAKTVIVGRARLGKIPMGVIISEVRTIEARAPADPAAPDSQERIWNQAGQVWFPDSAYKTAQAISDMNKEGLPLMLFANWRGFSGGQRDMFDQVLKYGAYIVDELVAYKQPVFVMITPGGELRGGAWVVVDPTINPDFMEMYSAPEGRGGVLEPAGAVSIKFRHKEVMATAHRVDDKLRALDAQLKEALAASSGTGTNAGGANAGGANAQLEVKALREKIAARERLLGPIFHQIAVQIGDLHDRPGRMLAKGVIRSIVPWSESRVFFYHRLQRRLAEIGAVRQIAAAVALQPDHAAVDALDMLRNLFVESYSVKAPDWGDDKNVFEWIHSAEGKAALQAQLAALRSDSIAGQVVQLGQQDPKAILKGLLGVIGKLQESGRTEERAQLVQMLRRGVSHLQ